MAGAGDSRAATTAQGAAGITPQRSNLSAAAHVFDPAANEHTDRMNHGVQRDTRSLTTAGHYPISERRQTWLNWLKHADHPRWVAETCAEFVLGD